ncbi:MAG: hypothetical protein AAGD14_03735 [Planctomycetota bacterium]
MKRFLIGFVVLLAIAMIGWVWYGGHARAEFERTVAELRAQGFTLASMEELDPEVPDERNAAILLRRAENRRIDLKLDFLDLAPEEAASVVRAADEYFALLLQAVALPEADFEIEWTQGGGLMWEPFELTSLANQALEARAGVLDPAGSHEARLRLANLLERPLGMALIFRATILTGVAPEIARLPNAIESRERFDALLRGCDDPSRLEDALHGEVALAVNVLERVVDGRAPIPIRLPRLLVDPLLCRSSTQSLLDQRDDYRIALGADGAALDRLERKGPLRLPAWETSAGSGQRGMLLILRQELEARAQLRLARIVLAVRASHERDGRWPDSLEPLFPEGVPVDPYERKPFTYDPGKRIVGGDPGIGRGVAYDLTQSHADRPVQHR